MVNHQGDEDNEIPIKLDNSVIGTMKINPRDYSAVEKNRDDLSRTKFAVAGLLYLLRYEGSVRNLLLVSVLVMSLSAWLQIDTVRAVLVFMALGLVWATESLNAAIEAVVDLVTSELHPMAKVAKDVAAGATLVATFTAATSTLALLGPPLLDKLGIA
jgi:diacylglycerol kinase